MGETFDQGGWSMLSPPTRKNKKNDPRSSRASLDSASLLDEAVYMDLPCSRRGTPIGTPLGTPLGSPRMSPATSRANLAEQVSPRPPPPLAYEKLLQQSPGRARKGVPSRALESHPRRPRDALPTKPIEERRPRRETQV